MVNYIRLTSKIKTQKGNFACFYDENPNEELFSWCLSAEQRSKEDFEAFRTPLRIAFELAAYDLKTRRLAEECGHSRPWQTLWEEVREKGENSLSGPDKTDSPKNILKDEIARRGIRGEALLKSYRSFLEKHSMLDPELYQSYRSGERWWTMNHLVNDLYHFASDGMHAGGTQVTVELCQDMLRLFHDFLHVIYGVEHVYQPYLCPIGEYFPIEKKYYRALGLIARRTPDIFVTERDGTVEYFLLKRATDRLTPTEKRELAALEKLWKRAADSPNNIPFLRGTVGDGPFRHRVFAFQSRPQALTGELLSGMTRRQRDTVCMGMLKAVSSLHSMKPPLPHRGLNPSSFYVCEVCETERSYRPMLVDFETVKDLSETASYTVGAYVRELDRDEFKRDFLAPEMRGEEEPDDLRKADIYSLGRLFAYVYTGQAYPSGKEPGLPEEKWALIRRMTDPDPAARPPLAQVLTAFADEGAARPAYAVCSVRGGRHTYEDAFYCSEKGDLEWEDQLTERPAKFPLILSVFDGMGGEEAGAEMAQLAARSAHKRCKKLLFYEYESYATHLEKLVAGVQEDAVRYIEEAGLQRAGTTMVLTLFTGQQAWFVNVGDSRLYHIHDHRVQLLTKDHCSSPVRGRKGPLYQYIGMPEEECVMDPFIARCDYSAEDYFLLCSDGLSDAVPEEEILEILYTPGTLEQKVWALVEQAEENGSRDNITAILFRKGTGHEGG